MSAQNVPENPIEEQPATESEGEKVTFKYEPDNANYTTISKHVVRAALLGNVVLMGFAFMLNFTAFYGLVNLQTTLNAKNSLGPITLVCHYVTSIFSNLFLPSAVIKTFGCKRTIFIALFMYLPYACSHFYVVPYTIIPAGIVSAIGTGPLWVAASIYLYTVSKTYARLVGASTQHAIWNIIGIFFMIIQSSQILGNGISAVELMGSLTETNKSILESMTNGRDFCWINERNEAILTERPKTRNMYMLLTIYITCIAGACLTIFFFVDSITRNLEGGLRKKLKVFRLFKDTVRLLKRRDQLEFIPLTIFVGCSQAFITGEFTKAFVGCTNGVEKIGFVMMCYGGMKCLSAIATGFLVRITGGAPIFITASLIHVSTMILLLVWEPKPPENLFQFLTSGLWGLCDGAWLVGLNAMYGILFPNEVVAAYSSCRLWEAAGYAIGHSNSIWLCTRPQVYILMVLLVIALAGYIDTEFRDQTVRRSNPETNLAMLAQ